MVMLEKVNDGTVAMYCGDKEDGDILAVEEYLPILPNTVSFLHKLLISISLEDEK